MQGVAMSYVAQFNVI